MSTNLHTANIRGPHKTTLKERVKTRQAALSYWHNYLSEVTHLGKGFKRRQLRKQKHEIQDNN